MKTVSIKQARERFAELVDQASRGSSIVITRRGRKVATLSPIASARRNGLPDLTKFRASLRNVRIDGATIEDLRREQRY